MIDKGITLTEKLLQYTSILDLPSVVAGWDWGWGGVQEAGDDLEEGKFCPYKVLNGAVFQKIRHIFV